MSRTVRKLVSADPDYDAGLDKYEVVESIQTTREVTDIQTIADCDVKIAKLQQMRTDDIVRWDAKIAAAEALKVELQGAL